MKLIRRTALSVSVVLIALLLGAELAAAQSVVLDDSASPKRRYQVQFNWAHSGAGFSGLSPEVFNRLAARVDNVEVRLNTSAFVGTQARIFLKFPGNTPGLAPGGNAAMTWTTQGTFVAGEVRQGERALLFDGIIPLAQMTEQFSFTWQVDARTVLGPLRFEPVYLIEPR